MIDHRWCQRCGLAKAPAQFRLIAAGNPMQREQRALRCMVCENTKLPPMLGVDIDRIHYKLGAVRKRRAA